MQNTLLVAEVSTYEITVYLTQHGVITKEEYETLLKENKIVEILFSEKPHLKCKYYMV